MRRHPHPTARAGKKIATKGNVAAAPGTAGLYGGFDLPRTEPRTSSAGARAGSAPRVLQAAGTALRDIEAWWAPESVRSTSAPGCRPTLA
jgi:hypothetical protein